MKSKKEKIIFIVFIGLCFLSLLIFTSILWCNQTFGDIEMDQLLFTILTPTSGSDVTIIHSWVYQSLLSSVFITILMGIGYYLLDKYILVKKETKIIKFFRQHSYILGILLLIVALINVETNLHVIDYMHKRNQKTGIYETKKKEEEPSDGDETIIYANPKDVKITGDQTNNLIYIYLESYENTFTDVENGGVKEVSCLPELTQLAKENMSFSNTDKMGGVRMITGTGWTIASMVGQSSGLPLKTEVANGMDKYDSFMPGAVMIGDILDQQGYIQELMIGSDAEFAGTDKLFSQHGNYNIVDYKVLKETGRLIAGDYNAWGVSDLTVFRNAKEDITKLADSGKKFNFTMATIDCHTPEGLTCSLCPDTYSNQYENIYACQSKQVYDFISWCKEQDWFEDTTIVIVGDHITMADKYVCDVPDDYVRTTYNCFINSKASTDHTSNRQFTALDMYPSTLAAMGFEIEGNKLSLGTNLFSKLPTTIEKYGLEYIEKEIQKSSTYLDENIYQFNEKRS